MTTLQIAETLKAGRHTVLAVRAEMNREALSKQGGQARRDQMRAMAADGYGFRQIAARFGLSEGRCRLLLRREGIEIERGTYRAKRHKADRIVSQMALDAENLTADVALIDFSDLDPSQLAGWIASFTAAHRSLAQFIRRLTTEEQKHGKTIPHAEAV